jgi:hypothetical protein
MTLLDEKAIHWIEGFLKDYLIYKEDGGELNKAIEQTTINIF